MKGEWERNKVPYPLAFDKPMEKKFDAFVSSLPFTLTDDQKTAVKEIAGIWSGNALEPFSPGDVVQARRSWRFWRLTLPA
jgi:RecG-like helicase